MTAPDGSGRRELAAAVALTLLGGGGALFAASRSWLRVSEPRLAPFGRLVLNFSGRALSPALNGLAIVALIIAVLVLITAGWARRVLGGLLLVVGLSAGWYAIRGTRQPSAGRVRELLGSRLSQQAGPLDVRTQPAPAWLALLGALLLVLAALLLLLRAGRWQVGLSAKYAAPVEVAQAADPWRRLDRGDDPTIFDG
ncbi:MAG: Trp biosynthesis-associated membrane protein [Actinomycetota bacterium]|nr:Trp biosynthesis-associated membrane protein [Actinomycetota bacterium]MDQ2955889.1 Trp biosynthesis-associated membrane protein [Actinomycetota bacterium]